MEDASARPSDGFDSSFSAIVEETPDPHGKFWVTAEQAQKLLPRVISGGTRLDSELYEILLKTQES